MNTPVKQDPYIGAVIDGAKIEKKLGEGGMGAVYLGKNQTLDKFVAIKILPPEIAFNKTHVNRFIREARLAAKLEHPNIVQIYNAGKFQNTYFISMQFVSGEALGEYLERNPKVPVNQALSIMQDSIQGLVFAHRNGVIHRDIKPENIMVTSTGIVKVVDFGIARSSEAGMTLSTPGQIIGTPHYMSPEQCNGKQVDLRSDIYSLGITFYKMISGIQPFSGTAVLELIRQHLDPKPKTPLIDLEGLDVPQELSDLVAKMMAKNLNERYQSLDETLVDLQKITTKIPPQPVLSKALTLPIEELNDDGEFLTKTGDLFAPTPPYNKGTPKFASNKTDETRFAQDPKAPGADPLQQRPLSNTRTQAIPNSQGNSVLDVTRDFPSDRQPGQPAKNISPNNFPQDPMTHSDIPTRIEQNASQSKTPYTSSPNSQPSNSVLDATKGYPSNVQPTPQTSKSTSKRRNNPYLQQDTVQTSQPRRSQTNRNYPPGTPQPGTPYPNQGTPYPNQGTPYPVPGTPIPGTPYPNQQWYTPMPAAPSVGHRVEILFAMVLIFIFGLILYYDPFHLSPPQQENQFTRQNKSKPRTNKTKSHQNNLRITKTNHSSFKPPQKEEPSFEEEFKDPPIEEEFPKEEKPENKLYEIKQQIRDKSIEVDFEKYWDDPYILAIKDAFAAIEAESGKQYLEGHQHDFLRFLGEEIRPLYNLDPHELRSIKDFVAPNLKLPHEEGKGPPKNGGPSKGEGNKKF